MMKNEQLNAGSISGVAHRLRDENIPGFCGVFTELRGSLTSAPNTSWSPMLYFFTVRRIARAHSNAFATLRKITRMLSPSLFRRIT
jgi:hypothetical protein